MTLQLYKLQSHVFDSNISPTFYDLEKKLLNPFAYEVHLWSDNFQHNALNKVAHEIYLKRDS